MEIEYAILSLAVRLCVYKYVLNGLSFKIINIYLKASSLNGIHFLFCVSLLILLYMCNNNKIALTIIAFPTKLEFRVFYGLWMLVELFILLVLKEMMLTQNTELSAEIDFDFNGK